MEPMETILELVNRFEAHHDAYGSPEYNETQVRREFIDPFFEALGWDVHNRQGFAEPYKQVIHEDAISIGGATKAPDYAFRLGGRRVFFVEAKKPAVNLKDDPAPAYQLRRYAWTAKLHVSILTNFAEFIVYDARVKPAQDDKASTARVLHISYTEYIERWGEITGLFSPEAIQKGALDKYVESANGKRGTAEVDDAFLAEIEEWRELLARNVALRNPGLSQRELNFAVQATIDRIVFLRICEDRGIEPYAQLMALLDGGDTYARLRILYDRADERYNSGLFHFHKEKGRQTEPDTVTPGLFIDEKILKTILRRLYYPESPYEFSVLPSEILGQVYERFLGSVIRLTAGGQAKVEQKPEVRKAGGVYYTPSYIVDYIVQHTVGRFFEGKTPHEVAGLTKTGRPAKNARPLAVLDPACGSGSFLLGAYQYLLDWHLSYYCTHDPERWARGKNPPICRAFPNPQPPSPKPQYRLTTTERKRILLAHIHGVDIDPQAVEVTKLSLLLKVLEGESGETLAKQFSLFHERALPDLDQNVRCGNSLIGPDFHQGRQMELDQEESYRVNAFDWNTAFPHIMRTGGFDAVIGNPPYGLVYAKDDIPYLSSCYKTFAFVQDGYVAFLEKAHSLLAMSGRLGYIIPSAWLGGPRYLPVREHLLGFSLESVVLLPFDVFPDAYIDTLLVTTQKTEPHPLHKVLTFQYPKRERIVEIDLGVLRVKRIRQKDWETSPDKKLVLDSGMLRLMDRLCRRCPAVLGDVVEMKRGVLFDRELLTERRVSRASHPYFEGSVYRFQTVMRTPNWVEFGAKMKEWPKEFRWFEGKRILLRRLVNRQQRLMATLVKETFITNKNLYSLICKGEEKPEFVLGVLNSKLLSRVYLSRVSQAAKDDFPQVTIKDVLGLPFKGVDFSDPDSLARHSKMVDLVQRMLNLHKVLQKTRTGHERTVLERQIAATDDEIDRLVYELYDLTDEEIAIVEESAT